MAMTFLQLCQRTREKCGISGTGPTSAQGQTGELLRVVNWVNEAWIDIQNEQDDWNWMRSEFTFNTVANQMAYTPATCTDVVTNSLITNFSSWQMETVRSYQTSVGVSNEQFMVPWAYDRYRNFYEYAVQPAGRPLVFAVRPRDRALLLGNIPDGIYTVRGEYQMSASLLVNDTDVPVIPPEFHMLIVYRAMMKYAMYESAPEVYTGAKKDYDRMMLKLSMNQLGDIDFGAPLA